MIWPVPGYGNLNERDTSREQGDGRFATRRVSNGIERRHAGIDIAAPEGTPIYAAGAGIISRVRRAPLEVGYGDEIRIDHDGGTTTLYGHLSEFAVAQGELVQAGQLVGWSGRTGNVPDGADAHLHYEVRVDGVSVDPFSFQTYRSL